MKISTLVLSYLVALFCVGTSLRADHECPDRIRYTNGNYLKNADRYYFSSGQYLLSSGRIYYPTGQYLKNADRVYYPNGNYLQSGSDLYYPNGQRLRIADRYYYSNGSYLKNGSNFYYNNGNYARRSGKLYRPDGTETPFPVTLRESIEAYGMVYAEVRKDSERIDVEFKDLLVNGQGVHLEAVWNGQGFDRFDFVLNTGLPTENVLVSVSGAAVICRLEGGAPPPPSQFTIDARPATVEVRTKPGYNPTDVRRALEQALESIQP